MNKDTQCNNCGSEFNYSESVNGFCPNCNSNQITRRIFVSGEIKFHETLKLAKHDKNFLKKQNPRQYIITGDDFYKKKKRWVKKEQIIDKDKDDGLAKSRLTGENRCPVFF